MLFNDTPNGGIIHGIIAVNDPVAKSDDARQFGNPGRDAGIFITQAIQGFADDLEFVLDRAAELPVGKVFVVGPSGAPLLDGVARVEHVKQQFACLVVHR